MQDPMNHLKMIHDKYIYIDVNAILRKRSREENLNATNEKR